MEIKAALNQIWHTQKRHALLTAAGGAGKSFLMKAVATDIDSAIPIYIDLSLANGDHFIFSEILKNYVGSSGEGNDISSRKELFDLFDTPSEEMPSYLLILDGIDDADKAANAGLHSEINEFSKCHGLQIILTVRTFDFLKTNYYFDQLKYFTHLSLQLLPPERRNDILRDHISEDSSIGQELLDVLRRPMFLSAFLDLSAGNTGCGKDLTSARELFSAVVSRDIDKQASQDGLYDKAEYAFHYLLPCLANNLNKVSFSSDELKATLYKSYFATSYKCEAFDGISADVITRIRAGSSSDEFPEFRRFVADEILQQYVNKIFIPRGYIVKIGASMYRFSHRNWLQYFQMEHLFNLMQRYEEDPSLSDIPALLGDKLGAKGDIQSYSRDELSNLILSAWDEATDDSHNTEDPRRRNRNKKLIRRFSALAAVLLLVFGAGYLISKNHNGDGVSVFSPLNNTTLSLKEDENYTTFVFSPGDMTISEFNAAAEIVRGRVETFVDGAPYEYEVENNQITFSIPTSTLHDHEIYPVMRCYLSRPLELYMVDRSSKTFGKVGYENIPVSRSDIQSVTLCEGPVDGLMASEDGTVPETVPYIQLVLTDDFISTHSAEFTNWEEQNFAWDITFDSWYFWAQTLPQSDGKTFYLIDNSYNINFIKTTVFNLTHSTIADGFYISFESSVVWEQPEEAFKAGELQCLANEVTGDDILTFYFDTGSQDTSSRDWFECTAEVKRRMDVLGQPYALGYRALDSYYQLAVKTNASTIRAYMPYILPLLGSSTYDYDEFLVHGTTCYPRRSGTYSSHLAPSIKAENDGSLSLHVVDTYTHPEITIEQYVSDVASTEYPEFYLFVDGLPILTATAEDVISENEIVFHHLYGHKESMTEKDRWLLELISIIFKGQWTGVYTSLSSYVYDDGRTLSDVKSQTDPVYTDDETAVVDAIHSVLPSATVQFGADNGEIIVFLDIYVDEDLPETARDQIKAVYHSFDFEHSRFNMLLFSLTDEDYSVFERARITFRKDMYDETISYNGIFQNGRLEKYKERFLQCFAEDPFFSSMVDYIGIN